MPKDCAPQTLFDLSGEPEDLLIAADAPLAERMRPRSPKSLSASLT